MALDILDIISFLVILVGSTAYFTKGVYWAVPTDFLSSNCDKTAKQSSNRARDISAAVQDNGKNCVFFYGSQTGTAEDYASRLAKEGLQRFGLKSMVADLADYDFDNLNNFPKDAMAVFVLATYGEGEPTDNAADFYEFITQEDISFGDGASVQPLSSLRYAVFGLGNSTYENYNFIARQTNKTLTDLGAQKVSEVGEANDGAGTTEEDFLTWKEIMWPELQAQLNLEERQIEYDPAFEMTEEPKLAEHGGVYLGEPSEGHLLGRQGPYSSQHPYIAPIIETREIFTAGDRNCGHFEIDLAQSGLSYHTGDHVAVLPTNPGTEVERFLAVFGLCEKRNTVIALRGVEMLKVPIPTPTTYDAAARYYMEICGPVSRQFISTLAGFAPDEESKAELTRMGSDKAYFRDRVSGSYQNLAQVVQSTTSKPFSVPFSLLVEGIRHIQPRYYSICSSSTVQKNRVGITALVKSIPTSRSSRYFRGVTTNYLLALKREQHGEGDPLALAYTLVGPHNKHTNMHVSIYIRPSNFRLPMDPTVPIIMVGPGTGVAPFRGFVQERATVASKGKKVGPTILFYGCRNRNEDFIYQQEWKSFGEQLGQSFHLIVAFSREGPQKVYVQHRLHEHASLVESCLLQQKGVFYVCGDAAHMAHDVHGVLTKIIAQHRNVGMEEAESVVKSLKSQGRYLEDVWS